MVIGGPLVQVQIGSQQDAVLGMPCWRFAAHEPFGQLPLLLLAVLGGDADREPGRIAANLKAC